MAVLEINDVKQGRFIALEIFFINHNSYMNEMHQHTDCVAFDGGEDGTPCLGGVEGGIPCLEGGEGGTPCLGGIEGGTPCLGRSEGGTPCLGGEGGTHYLRRGEGGTGVKTAILFMIETRAVIYDRNVHCPNRYLATRRKVIIGSVIVAQ